MRRTLCNVVVVTIVLSSGCAAIMKDPPKPDRRPSDPPACSEGRGGVVLDGLLAGSWAIGSLALMSEDEAGLGLGMGLLAGLHIVSAISGHRSASRCHQARAEYAAWRRGDELRERAAERRRVELPERAARGRSQPAPAETATAEPPPEAETAAGPAPEAETAAGPAPETRPPRAEPRPSEPEPTPLRPRDRRNPYRDFWREVRP